MNKFDGDPDFLVLRDTNAGEGRLRDTKACRLRETAAIAQGA